METRWYDKTIEDSNNRAFWSRNNRRPMSGKQYQTNSNKERLHVLFWTAGLTLFWHLSSISVDIYAAYRHWYYTDCFKSNRLRFSFRRLSDWIYYFSEDISGNNYNRFLFIFVQQTDVINTLLITLARISADVDSFFQGFYEDNVLDLSTPVMWFYPLLSGKFIERGCPRRPDVRRCYS